VSSTAKRIAVCPVSFDPFHRGHEEVVERCRKLFDEVVVGVLHNESKQPLFSLDERVAMIRELFTDDRSGDGRGLGDVRVESFSGLLVAFAREQGAVVVVKGLRNAADFDYELQMERMNRHVAPGIETVFLPPREEWSFLSSSLIKEVAGLGGDVSALLPESVHARLMERLRA
jgi:pantetheine-phosphate adenylyltransferase